MKWLKNKYIKTLSGLVVGGVLGYAYYYYIGCSSGSCAITSNPVNSTAYGALIGLIMRWPEKDKSVMTAKEKEI